LGCGALVIPQDSRAQHRARFVQQHQPVHLPGQTHRGYCLARHICLAQRFLDAGGNTRPPLYWILF
jgi:hypothetical protein